MRHFNAYTATATFTPAAAAYLANDIMDVIKTLTWTDGQGLVYPGGVLMVLSSRLQVNATAVVSGETSYNLHLYNTAPAVANADNDAWNELDADIGSYDGPIALGTPVDIGSQLEVFTDGINRPLVVSVNASGKTLAHLVTVGAFTATAKARKVVLTALDLSR